MRKEFRLILEGEELNIAEEILMQIQSDWNSEPRGSKINIIEALA